MHCTRCGHDVSPMATACPQCGHPVYAPGVSHHGKLVVLLLALFVGGLGVHRFYVGKIGTGLLMLVTLGGLGLWTLIDIILIACDSFTDADGLRITRWQ